MRYRIIMNRACRSKYDKIVENLEGVYFNFEHAIREAYQFKVLPLPDNSAWLYPPELSDEQIRKDVEGRFALGSIEEL